VTYENPQQYVVALVQPFSDGTSYAILEINEYDAQGNIKYIDTIETCFKSRDVHYNLDLDFTYIDRPNDTVSENDKLLGRITVSDLINSVFYDLRNDYHLYISDIGYLKYSR